MNRVPVFQREEFWRVYGAAPEYREREDYLLQSLPRGTESLLDVGCGNGLLVTRIDATGSIPLVIGVDLSEAALRQGSFLSVAGKLPKLPFRDREFDVVVCLEVFEHIPDAAYSPAIAELVRVAGEHIFIGVPYREKLMTKTVTCAQCGQDSHIEGHLRAYDERNLSGLFPGWTLVSTAILGRRVIRLPDWVSSFRRRFLGHSYMTQDFSCPHCGGGAIFHPPASSFCVVRILGDFVVRAFRRWSVHKPYWIIGHYRRTSAAQTGRE